MDGTIDPHVNNVESISRQLRRHWPSIEAARIAAQDVQRLLSQILPKVSSADIDVVAFGSLARQEWTIGSDVDWTILVDSPAELEHRQLAREVEMAIAQASYKGRRLPQYGSQGVAAHLTFSHDIVHNIGGDADTVRNSMWRNLLLVESAPLRQPGSDNDSGSHGRVARTILSRYLHDDTTRDSVGSSDSRIPRLLLNDIVRHWRTMCVGFAHKEWDESGGGKWALRNMKLKMSRKLIFVAGLLTVFSCYRNASLRLDAASEHAHVRTILSHLMNFVRSTPLNIVAWAFSRLGLFEEAGSVFDCYDTFIGYLNDEGLRNHLQAISPNALFEDRQFLAIREVCHHFQDGLSNAFFRADTELRDFTIKYGVF